MFLALGIISGIISLMVRRMLLGFTPQGLANTYLTQSEMLDSLDEGVVFVDPKGKVQLVNQAAENILGQKRSKLEGAPLDAILRTREETTLLDCTGENLSTSRPNVLANILVRDDQNKKPGLTLILKDKTEAVRKAEQLNGTQHIVTALRANNHEFMNRLQVIAGLLQIGRTQEALDYIGNVASIHSQAIGPIIQNIQNPSVAALLLGKANHAHELEIGLTLLSGSTLPPHSAYLSTNELVTVLGNLLGNAIEAVNAQGSGNSRSVAVQITEDEKEPPDCRIGYRHRHPAGNAVPYLRLWLQHQGGRGTRLWNVHDSEHRRPPRRHHRCRHRAGRGYDLYPDFPD